MLFQLVGLHQMDREPQDLLWPVNGGSEVKNKIGCLLAHLGCKAEAKTHAR